MLTKSFDYLSPLKKTIYFSKIFTVVAGGLNTEFKYLDSVEVTTVYSLYSSINMYSTSDYTERTRQR